MPGFNINDIRANFQFGGARPTLFNVQMTLPPQIDQTAAEKFQFTCSAASVPSSDIGVMAVPYFGRRLPFAGDRGQFQPWRVNIMNDEDFKVRDAMETWHNLINARVKNTRQFSDDTAALYKVDAQVTQYKRTGENDPLRIYKFVGMWPSAIGEMQLDWNAIDQMQTFSITFQYDYWDLDDSTGNVSSDNQG